MKKVTGLITGIHNFKKCLLLKGKY